MRIALVPHAPLPAGDAGGVDACTLQRAQALARLGHDVHVFVGAAAPDRHTWTVGAVTVTRLHKVGMLDRLLPPAGAPRLPRFRGRLAGATDALAALRLYLRRRRFDVVEVAAGGGEGALLGHCLDLPVVVRLQPEPLWAEAAGSGIDRVLAGMIDRLALTGARALIAGSHWQQAQLRAALAVYRPIAVIPPGIDLDEFDRDDGGDPLQPMAGRLCVFAALGARPAAAAAVLAELLPPLLQKHAAIGVAVAGDAPALAGLAARLQQDGHGERLLLLPALPPAALRACRKRAAVVLQLDPFEVAPVALLEAMAAGAAIVADERGGTQEVLRHETDGILADAGSAAALRRGLDRLLQSEARRRRCGQSARARVGERFRSEPAAQAAAAFFARVLGQSPSAPPAPGQHELGAGNWFDAWWLAGGRSGPAPVAAADLAGLSLDELSFVHTVLARVYWGGAGHWGSPESDFLNALAALYRAGAAAAQQAGSEPQAGGKLTLPSLQHPLFDDEAAATALVDELWRLGDTPAVDDWLQQQAAQEQWAARAGERLVLRRLLVEAARRRPGPVTFARLRTVYRTPALQAQVLRQDQEFIAAGGKGLEFAALVRQFGLHAPLQRPPALPRRRPKPAPDEAGPADVTVLIPSYRHEAYVAAAIQSALQQTHRRLRVLVVDDHSPDGTVDAARSIDDPRLEVRANAHNLGLGGSIAAAVAGLATPYVALLNSDDLFHPDRLRSCLQVLEQQPEVDLVATGLSLMDGDGRRLTTELSCALDIGMLAHDWVHWYDRVLSGLTADDWTSPAALLRHNHLATSSNIVCRTAFLQRHADATARLKYCLDWALFLRAAVAGSLAFLPEPLLAYRLHDANTVWFAEAARPGYVLEVNAVVADALRALATRRRQQGVEPRAVVEEIAGLLHRHVRRHGESDGFSMFLAELVRELPGDPATVGAYEVARLTAAALAAPARDADAAARARIDHHAAEAFGRRARELEPEVARLGSELAAAWQRVEDIAVLRRRLDEELQEQQRGSEQLAATVSELEQQRQLVAQGRQQLQQAADELAAQRQQLLELQQQLQQQVQELQQQLLQRDDQLRQQGEALAAQRQQHSELQEQHAQLQRAQEQLQQQLQASGEELQRTFATLAAARQQLAFEQQRHRADVDAATARFLALDLQQREQLQELQRGYEYRLGRLLLRKLHLLPVFKTLLRAGVHLRARGGRALRRLSGGGMALIAGGPFPAAAEGRLAAHARLLREAGLDAPVFAFGAHSPATLAAAVRPQPLRVCRQFTDAALQAADRRYWQRRRSELAAAVAAEAPWLAPRVFTLARSLAAARRRYLHAVGLGDAAREAMWAARLCGGRFGLSVTAADLREAEAEAARELLRQAALCAADSEATGALLRRCADSALPSLLVLPSPAFAGPPVPSGDAQLFACIGPFADAAALPLLAEACRRAVERGSSVRFEVAGSAVATAVNLEALERLRRRAARLGVGARFTFLAGGSADDAALLQRAAALVDLGGADGGAVAALPPAVTAAMAAGRPVVGIAGGLDPVLRDGEHGLLAEPTGDALGDALHQLASEPALAHRLGAAAAHCHRQLQAEAAAAFAARVRELAAPAR